MDLFATCGSGLEPFAVSELREKFDIGISVVEDAGTREHTFPGKLFFRVPDSNVEGVEDVENVTYDAKYVLNLLNGLKTVERLFGVILAEAQRPMIGCDKRSVLTFLYEMSSRPELKKLFIKWAAIKEAHTNLFEQVDCIPDSDKPDQEPPAKKQRSVPATSNHVEFRVNVKLTGRFRKACSPREVSKAVGSGLVKNMASQGWRINLRNPTLEVSLYLTNDGTILAVPLSLRPLSERSYMTHMPLRSTVAYAMASLVFEDKDNRDGRHSAESPICVLDPMCGTGTILIEMAHNFQEVDVIYGVDMNGEQVSKCSDNIATANVQNKVFLLQCDSTRISPLKVDFDFIISDLPFGQQHGTRAGTLADLPNVIRVMDDCLKPGGRVVLLISQELGPNLEAIVLQDNIVDWRFVNKYRLKLGELHALILVFKK